MNYYDLLSVSGSCLGLVRGVVLDGAGSRWAWLGLASVWLEADGIAESCDLLGA